MGEVDVPSTTKVAEGVVEPMPTLWLAVTRRMEMPEEEETSKGSTAPAPVPWMRKDTAEEVALTPMTVPSYKNLVAPLKAEADVQ